MFHTVIQRKQTYIITHVSCHHVDCGIPNTKAYINVIMRKTMEAKRIKYNRKLAQGEEVK